MKDTTDDIPPRRSDGERTHAAILEEAMRVASIEGLGSLTIGRISRELGVSKSGVFAHFRSKRRLQEETVAAATVVFRREVLEPALSAEEGLPRLEALCEAYLSYLERGVFPGGCFFAHLLAEFDAQSGLVYEEVVTIQRGWLGLLEEQIAIAQRNGSLASGLAPDQLAFELYAPLELANYLATLYRDVSLVERGRCSVRNIIARAEKAS